MDSGNIGLDRLGRIPVVTQKMSMPSMSLQSQDNSLRLQLEILLVIQGLVAQPRA